eukprot:CAMPEP_0117527768 /NCGR_PEP_ID=MMETSP0784-20121206/36969_1 /TAXON_ID=39447 /ORGANISM="" /LENGTH=446 /DNA_ID=CAMNT_0005324033 /DNA_START=20 /DNA_END=1361 /DNA_ORIENTATION=-
MPKMEGLAALELGPVIAEGRFATIRMVRRHDATPISRDGDVHGACVKILRKRALVENKEVEHTMFERNVMASCDHHYIVKLYFTMQDPTNVYIVMDYSQAGDLFCRLRSVKRFSLATTRVYAAEVLAALVHLHEMLIAYRDLKPENILFSNSGHMLLTDFGLAKSFKDCEKSYTVVGTCDYMAPELIKGTGHGMMVDHWAYGVLLFEMLAGQGPFAATEEAETVGKIMNVHFSFPPAMDTHAKDMISRLLTKDPVRRMSFEEEHPAVVKARRKPRPCKAHPFFGDIDWNDVAKGALTPPWVPFEDSKTSEGKQASTPAEWRRALAEVSEDDGDGIDQQVFKGWDKPKSIREESIPVAAARKQKLEQAMIDRLEKEEEEKRALDKEFEEACAREKVAASEKEAATKAVTHEKMADDLESVVSFDGARPMARLTTAKTPRLGVIWCNR